MVVAGQVYFIVNAVCVLQEEPETEHSRENIISSRHDWGQRQTNLRPETSDIGSQSEIIL
jgi:hypothetical protein